MSARWSRLSWFVPAVAAVLTHATSLRGGFVWLDHGDIEAGAALAGPPWWSLFTHGFARTGFYRPLMALSLSVDAALGGARVFHASNLLWHAAAATACLFAARTWRLSSPAAVLCALLFAVHPVTGVVVNVVSNRQESMVTAALFALVWAVRTARPVSALVAALLAALTKETGLVLLLPVAVCAALASVEGDTTGWRKRLSQARWPLFSAVVAATGGLALRTAFGPMLRSRQPDLNLTEHLSARLTAFSHAGAALLSSRTSVCDTVRLEPLLSWHHLGALAVLGLLAVVVARHRFLGLLLAWCALPLAQVVPGPRFWAPHYVYVPLGWLCLVLAMELERRPRLLPIGGLLGLLLGGFSLVDAPRFASDSSLFGAETCREARSYYGDWLRREGRLDEAVRVLELASEPPVRVLEFCDEAFTYQSLGLTRLAQRNDFEAELAFEKALELQSDPVGKRRITHDLAAVALLRGDPATTERLLRDEVLRGDALRESLELMARALLMMGRAGEAQALFERSKEK